MQIICSNRTKRRNMSESTGPEYLDITFKLTLVSKHNAENKQRL
jgi:hypothetical protein